MDKNITVEIAHDRHGVIIFTGNDMIEFTPNEAIEFANKLGKAAQVAHKNTPKAPRPIMELDVGHTDKEKEFASVGSSTISDKCTPSFAIGGYDLGLEDAKVIRDWLNKAIDYVEEK